MINFFSAAVDHKRRFVEVTARWPGSVHDARIFANSRLNANLERMLSSVPDTPVATKTSSTSSETQQENIPAFILADSAYPSTSRVVPTYKNHECSTRDIRNLNARLAAVRYSVENAFGICKGRFRLLNRPLECAKENVVKASYLITAIFVVHNFIIDENDDTPIPAEDIEADDSDGNQDTASAISANELESDEGYDGDEFEGIKTRDILLRHIYWKNN